MSKKYEYDEKIYCEDDLSEEIENYGGGLYDLFFALSKAGEASEVTYYYNPNNPDDYYEDIDELIENEFDDLEVER